MPDANTIGAEKVRGRPAKYPGLAAACISLGVTYQHLWACVSGRRNSPGLMKRYQEYQRSQAGSANRNEVTAIARAH